MSNGGNDFRELEKIISREKKIISEMNTLAEGIEKNSENERMISSQINSLKRVLRKENDGLFSEINGIVMAKQMKPSEINTQKKESGKLEIPSIGKNFLDRIFPASLQGELKLNSQEKGTIKRLREKEKNVVVKREKKPGVYVSLASRIFSNFSAKLVEKGMFKKTGSTLVKANMEFLPRNYMSVTFLTTLISAIFSLMLFGFFLLFDIHTTLPLITPVTEGFLSRIAKTLWILIAIPAGTFLFMYFYPSLEKESIEGRINQELPFAAINMAAISSAMIDPTKVFEIIMSTKEYPHLEKEFGKIINGVNVFGYDLISVLRNVSATSPSKKLSDLLNGIATTIGTGGDLPKFFDERAKSLLFEYNLEKEKSTKTAETFMDIYISVVIAAPMILMLLLIIMQVSGLGISLTTSMISLIMVLGVSVINVFFLVFLYIKQSGES